MQKKIISFFSFTVLLVFLFLNTRAQSHEANINFLQAMQNACNNTALLNNSQNILPIKNLDKRKFVSLHLGFAQQYIFDSILNKYVRVDALSALLDKGSMNNALNNYTTVILALDENILKNKEVLSLIATLSNQKELIVCFFGEKKNNAQFKNLIAPVIWSKDNDFAAAFVVPQIIFGGINLAENSKAIRLKFTVPEELNINTDDLKSIDSIAFDAIAKHATPGLVVLAAKDGKVFFNKAYGTHTYDDNIPDKITDLFDMASVTKITATTPVVMRLYDEGKLNLDTTIGYYLPQTRNTPMNDIHLREVMLHQAGFVPFIPFYQHLQPSDFSKDSSADYPTKVADHFFIRKDFFKNVMWQQMMNTPLKTRGKYVYSDISMYTMQQIVEHITNIPLNKFVLDSFYKPLGMQVSGYLPRERVAVDKIIPTENDTSFRHQLLVGYVHDEGAALKGGVAGHAGLFANSIDLAIYYQMLLNGGSYGGTQYLKPETVEYFTDKQSSVSRRGLGFDRADTAVHYPSRTASPETFGHTGFTGTCVWVDKKRDLIYIFLSNRVNPYRSHELGNVRPKIEDALNAAIDKASGK